MKTLLIASAAFAALILTSVTADARGFRGGGGGGFRGGGIHGGGFHGGRAGGFRGGAGGYRRGVAGYRGGFDKLVMYVVNLHLLRYLFGQLCLLIALLSLLFTTAFDHASILVHPLRVCSAYGFVRSKMEEGQRWQGLLSTSSS